MLSSFRVAPSLLIACAALLGPLALAACSDGDGSGDGGADTGGGLGGPGDMCTTVADCQDGLDCIDGICTLSSNGAVGDPCIYTAQCMDGLYCSIPRTCQNEGTGGMFSTCTDSGDCEAPLVCEPQAEGPNRCVDAGSGDIGSPGDGCTTVADCQAGLFCIDGECRGQQGGGTDGGTGDGGAGDGGPPDAMLGGPCESVVDCEDGNACTIDQCVATNCRYTLIDSDEDGYASTLLGSCGRDCSDMNPSVNPDHTDFETTRHEANPSQPRTYDWDCNGTEEKQWTTLAPACNDELGTCASGEGWAGIEAPACGMTVNWVRCVVSSGVPCRIEVIESRTQSCR